MNIFTKNIPSGFPIFLIHHLLLWVFGRGRMKAC
jgi:hypothetical protein